MGTVVEVDTLADILGSKYVENTKTKYVQADVKDTSNIKDVTAHEVSNLKKDIANKVSSEIKVDKIKKVVLSKKAGEEKVEENTKNVKVEDSKKEEKSLIDFKGFVSVSDERKPTA